MRTFFVPVVAFVLVAFTYVGLTAVGAQGSQRPTPTVGTTIHVVEHALTDTVVHLSKKSDALGDQLAFGNPVFDVSNKQHVGSDQGHCVRVVVGKAWECFWTIILTGGQITVEGPFDDASDTVLAVTGGTGAYNGARGQMTLHARNAKGTEYDFIYRINAAG